MTKQAYLIPRNVLSLSLIKCTFLSNQLTQHFRRPANWFFCLLPGHVNKQRILCSPLLTCAREHPLHICGLQPSSKSPPTQTCNPAQNKDIPKIPSSKCLLYFRRPTSTAAIQMQANSFTHHLPPNHQEVHTGPVESHGFSVDLKLRTLTL